MPRLSRSASSIDPAFAVCGAAVARRSLGAIPLASRICDAVPDAEVAAELGALGISQLPGGNNNKLFRWDLAEGPAVLKLYRHDGPDRGLREVTALTAAREHGFTGGPAVLWHDLEGTPVAAVLGWIDGAPLTQFDGPRAALDRAAISLRDLHARMPGAYPFGAIGSAENAGERIERWFAPFATRVDPLARAVSPLLQRWRAADDLALLLATPERAFSTGDPNPANWLWTGERLGLVDWEYAGLLDPVFQLADVVEFVRARRWPDAAWARFLSHFDWSDPARRTRFEAARRTLALAWVQIRDQYADRASDPYDITALEQCERARAVFDGERPLV